MPPSHSPYSGTKEKLVLAFDVGTTFSGISYCLLEPGHVPKICGVTRYPAQKSGGDSKIPTIVYYDQAGNVRSCGAEAKQPSILEQVITENWVLVEWFKLHMRPQSISGSDTTHSIPNLPPGKSVIDVLADFIYYLHLCAREFIIETHANGEVLWQTVKNEIDYVLSHPNGWEGQQQQQIRLAVVKAGLIPNTPMGQQRIRLVTEGEASLHFCIEHGLNVEPMKNGDGILLVDAGKGTIDISAYGEASDMTIEEIAAPACYLQGSVFVTTRAHSFLNEYLKDSRYNEDISDMISEFDQSAKLAFENPAKPVYIRFGRPRDFDPKYNIRAGQLCLSGTDVAKFFQPSIDCIVNAIVAQRRKVTKRIASVFLVGSFSTHRYLFSQIRDAPALADIDICRPDCHLNQAVADGAISFYLHGYINVRRPEAFTKGDQATVADVIDLVKALNVAILQAAAFISDPQHLFYSKGKVPQQDMQRASEAIGTHIGTQVADVVKRLKDLRKDPEDSTLLQVALQIAMARLCEKMINAWSLLLPGADLWLKAAYEKIRASEGPTVAGRWRALTRAQGGGAEEREAILNRLMDRLKEVLVAIGSQIDANKFRNIFQNHLTTIVDHIIRIQVTAMESITSVDVIPYSCPPGTEFTIDSMEDTYSSRATKDIAKGIIAGTTGLGLRQQEKKADATGQQKDEYTYLLKAEVVLVSALKERVR